MPPHHSRLSSAGRLAEFPLIEDLARRFGATGRSVLTGIGDDAAILQPPSGSLFLLTTDLLAEGVHFDLTTATFEAIGYKAAVANLSDIAAMGGIPRYLLVSLAIPSSHTRAEIRRLYQGMMSACRPHRVELIGGDTSSSRQGL
ncbi:MAG: thiamine-monophosphate kinase, partial [bacterium]